MIFSSKLRRRLERNVVGVSSISKDDTKGAETLKNAPSSPSPYIFATSSSSSSSNKLSPTSQTNNMISPSITSSRSSILKKYVKKINKRNLEQASAIPIGNQIFFKIKDISQTYASAVALRIVIWRKHLCQIFRRIKKCPINRARKVIVSIWWYKNFCI